MESRVGTLELTIRGERPAIDGVRPDAEAFAIRVLERCDEILERRHPGRVFVLQHLDLHLRISERDFDDAGVEALAADIVDRVERVARAPGDADVEEDVVAFADVADWYASAVEAHAHGTPNRRVGVAPSDHESASTIQALIGDRPLLREVLLRLHRRGTLRAMLRALPEDTVSAIARVLGREAHSAPREPHAAVRGLPPAVARSVTALSPITSAALAWIVIVIAAYDDLGSSCADADVRDVAERAMAALDARRPSRPTAVARHDDRLEVSASRIVVTDAPDQDGPTASAFGGLFYLLRLAVEALVPEILWRACLPEGVVLSHAIALLLEGAAANDPAPLLFGGIDAPEPLPSIAEEQQVEISQSVFGALLDALVFRQLIAKVEPVLQLADTVTGRLLVVSGEGSPYVIFARPANSRDDIVAALDAFLSMWPMSAPPPRAGDALAAFDRRGRVREWRGRSHEDAPLVSNAGSLFASALLTQAAGTLAHMFAARAGADPHARHRHFVERYFRVPALVAMTPGTLDVRMSMDVVNLDVRRAGLDIDPGWIPWLNRRVTFTFEDTDGRGQDD